MKSITEIFPRASKSFIAENPQWSGEPLVKSDVQPIVATKRGVMNKTEQAYADILEAMKRKGEILRYEYEGITLRWADMRYTPDFLVIWSDTKVIPIYQYRFIEVKGGHIWDRDIVRFKGARAYWPEFQFEMWQKKKGQWNRLH